MTEYNNDPVLLSELSRLKAENDAMRKALKDANSMLDDLLNVAALKDSSQ